VVRTSRDRDGDLRRGVEQWSRALERTVAEAWYHGSRSSRSSRSGRRDDHPDREDARWLPSRFRFALFRLYALLRLRFTPPRRQPD